MKELEFRSPVALAIAAGATTPNPGLLGVQIWSTTTGSMLVWNGAAWVATSAASTASVDTVSYSLFGGF